MKVQVKSWSSHWQSGSLSVSATKRLNSARKIVFSDYPGPETRLILPGRRHSTVPC